MAHADLPFASAGGLTLATAPARASGEAGGRLGIGEDGRGPAVLTDVGIRTSAASVVGFRRVWMWRGWTEPGSKNPAPASKVPRMLQSVS